MLYNDWCDDGFVRLLHQYFLFQLLTPHQPNSFIHQINTKATKTPVCRVFKNEGNLRWSGRVSSSCSTSGTRHVILIKKSGDKSWKGNGRWNCDYHKRNISVVIYDTDILSWYPLFNFRDDFTLTTRNPWFSSISGICNTVTTVMNITRLPFENRYKKIIT